MMSVGLTFTSRFDAQLRSGLVGPNSIVQLVEALRALPETRDDVKGIFAGAGCSQLLNFPPTTMIDEAIPARLFDALWCELVPETASRVAHDAGRRTGAYLIANRIPAAAQLMLKILPQRLATTVLLKAIQRNAWTFVGSGDCIVVPGDPATISIFHNPLIMPGCVWHIGVFEALFRALISKDTQVTYATSNFAGQSVCHFEVRHLLTTINSKVSRL